MTIRTPSARRRNVIGVVAICILTLAACGGGGKTQRDGAEPSPKTSIVGVWTRLTTCEQRVKALDDAGLGEYAAESVAGDGLIPGVTDADQLEDRNDPCRGAKPVKHSHFFTEDGQFGSLDDTGQQVDDGPYRLVGKDSVVIGEVTFHYTATRDTLTLEPVLPGCAKSGCFDAQWAVAVSYNGLPWQRTG
jgi:hypothetical protein